MGWTIIDTSTAPVSLARRLYAEFEGKACAFADSPIARTRQAAIDGTLSIMVATPIARVFAAEVSLSFDRLTGAAEACGKPNVRRILRVSAPTTFASRWLIPRLGRFHDSHPLVEVSVTTVSTVLEELRGGFDIAIRRGSAKTDAWPQYRATYMPRRSR